MKIDKKKVVFGSVLVCVLGFIISYCLVVFGGDQEQEQETISDPEVPQLKEETKTYDSRLNAINDLREKKPSLAPSLYDEMEEEQQEWSEDQDGSSMDSLPPQQAWTMESWSFNRENAEDSTTAAFPGTHEVGIAEADIPNTEEISPAELALAQELFFSSTNANDNSAGGKTDSVIRVFVDGQQVVRANSRLRLRLMEPARIGGKELPRLSPVYGFVSFAANRVKVNIEQVMHRPVSLKAYDVQDGSEGIYVENNFRAEASREILDDALGEINIPSLPQVSGISRLFQKHNRNIKVSVSNRYQLLLKPEL
ncbi:conjugative transposon protein TraM [Zunongwangia sp. F363]|uniref:Conjugative transposon protein TraM n=1 Tax=Autumnicola tepida TaxID=3075595 RepID=A0ABU3C804_9FLAO|nr:conjugative transposon protein TraM [Zunongwangia sp. F363]MDT0642205.1 conjugative transposon protein TraM [Zunongwangia sp. F363]